mgnify:FL=1
MRHSRAIKEVLRDARVARDGKFVYYYIEEKLASEELFMNSKADGICRCIEREVCLCMFSVRSRQGIAAFARIGMIRVTQLSLQ